MWFGRNSEAGFKTMTAGRGYVRNVGRGYVINEWQRLCNDKGGHRAARAAKKRSYKEGPKKGLLKVVLLQKSTQKENQKKGLLKFVFLPQKA